MDNYKNKYKECKAKYLLLKKSQAQVGGGLLKDNLIAILGYDEEKATRYERELDPRGTATAESLNRLFGEAEEKERTETGATERQFIVYTTGLGYGLELINPYLILKDNVMRQLAPHYDNIIFRHYDGVGFNADIIHAIEDASSHDIPQEFYEQNLDVVKCREIQGEDHLIIDIAHIFGYGFNKMGHTKATIYYEPEDASAASASAATAQARVEDLNLNVFYPGFLLDYSNDEFIANFRYIHVNDDKSMTTFIDKIVIFRLDLALTVDPTRSETNEHIIVAPKKGGDRALFYIPTMSRVYNAAVCNSLIWRE